MEDGDGVGVSRTRLHTGFWVLDTVHDDDDDGSFLAFSTNRFLQCSKSFQPDTTKSFERGTQQIFTIFFFFFFSTTAAAFFVLSVFVPIKGRLIVFGGGGCLQEERGADNELL